MKDYNGQGVWIPYEILQSDELTSTEKILYAEIYYLDNPYTHCTASNEHLAKFLGISESGLKKCLTHLRSLGYIETISFDGRNRVLATTVKWSNQIDTPVSSRRTQDDTSESYKNEFLLYKENKKVNSIENSTGAGASLNHPRNFSRNTLSDDLESGKDIDEQKKEKKKASEFEKCHLELDNRYEPAIQMLLRDHLNWSYNSKDVNRIKTVKMYRKRLDELDRLTGDKAKIIQQSIDKQWHCFYELKENKSFVRSTKDNDGIVTNTYTEEDKKRIIAERVERNGII